MLVLFAFSLLWSSLGDLSGSVDMCRVYSFDLFSLQIYARRSVWFLPFSGCLRDHLRTPIISISWVYKICTPPKLNVSSLRYHRCTNLRVLHFQFVRRRQQIANSRREMRGGLLEIEPKELKFVFELKKQSSCSLELINKTDQYLAFKLSDNQAQKMFGNRWTEIAKVVSGKTDNAVKHRLSTLCKKRAKFEASSKENSVPSLDPSNKRVLVEEPSISILIGEPSTSNKQMG
ncbi:hypothetical protein ZIOFF_060287 [Zingiber officinale]|uniref:HTH myb-type domain-containing protein n=1 Tax=Zingiber officinale TaxID=94328 RepID=A0A8J5FGH7_ZINOF|nr:hypothetical protein ZIOFF_060287 [Zingiber officinale]